MDNMKVVHSANLGDTVICDFCNADGLLSKGGVVIGSNAVCGDCCDKYDYYNDKEVDEVFDIPLNPLLGTQTPDPSFKSSIGLVCFWYRENRIWGATAKILKQIAELKAH